MVTSNTKAAPWDGSQGVRWAEHQDSYDASFGEITPAIFARAGVGAGDRVLDIGCGCGQTSRIAARQASPGRVLGVDVSSPMLERARLLAERAGLDNVDYLHADAETYGFEPGGFDVAVSRCGVMWFSDDTAAFTNIGSALREGGRLVFACWQEESLNPASGIRDKVYVALGLEPPASGPGRGWLNRPEQFTAMLEAAGFTGVALDGVVGPRRLGADVEEAFELHLGGSSSREAHPEITDADVTKAIAVARAELAPWLDETGAYAPSAAWVVSATRR